MYLTMLVFGCFPNLAAPVGNQRGLERELMLYEALTQFLLLLSDHLVVVKSVHDVFIASHFNLIDLSQWLLHPDCIKELVRFRYLLVDLRFESTVFDFFLFLLLLNRLADLNPVLLLDGSALLHTLSEVFHRFPDLQVLTLVCGLDRIGPGFVSLPVRVPRVIVPIL